MKLRVKRNLSFFLLISTPGMIFRFWSGIQKDFLLDEAISWSFARQSISQMLKATAADNHPPLYYLLLHFWLKLGQNEVLLRFPSLLFGLISIFLVYQVALKLFNQKIAILSSLIFSLSPLHVYFSTETRMYSLWTMLSLAIFYSFLKILNNPQKKYYILYTIYYILSLYTHYSTIFFLLALDLFLILKRKKFRKQLSYLLFSQAVTSLFFLPWAYRVFTNPHPRPWGISPPIGIPATFISFILGGVGDITLKTFFAPSVLLFIKTFFILTSVFFALLFFLGIMTKGKEEEKGLLLMTIFPPILMVTIISLFHPIYSPRQFLILAPYFYILVSFALEKMAKRILVMIAAISLVLVLLTQNLYPSFKPQTFKKTTEFIKKQSPSPIIVHTDILTFYPLAYYFKETADQFILFPSELTQKTTDIIGGSPVSLSQVTEKNKPFWSVHFTWDEKTWQFKKEYLPLENFQSQKVKTINDLEIFYYHP